MNEEKIKDYFDKINQEKIEPEVNKPKQKKEKIGKGRSYQEIDDTQKLRLEALKNSNIDFKKHGWTVLVADLLSMPSQKVRKFLENSELDIEEGAEVDIIVDNDSELGVNVIVNQKYAGLIYHDEVFQELHSGDQLKGYLKKIRENNKLDISLQASGYQHVEPNANKILEEMRKHNGYLALHDGSDPQDIYQQIGMSKKTFKKAIGLLYKQKLIVMEEAGIRLI